MCRPSPRPRVDESQPMGLQELEFEATLLENRVKSYEAMYERALAEWVNVKTKLAVARELRERGKASDDK